MNHEISTDLLASWHGSIIATLAVEVGSKTERSLPAWVIQGDDSHMKAVIAHLGRSSDVSNRAERGSLSIWTSLVSERTWRR